MVDDMIVRRTPRTRGRPRALLLLTALVAACAATPAAAGAAAPERATYRTQQLPAGTAVAGAARANAGRDGAKTTRIDFRTKQRFSLAALRWPNGSKALTGRLRAQRADGSWTDWSDLESDQAGPDGVVEEPGAPGAAAAKRRGAKVGRQGSTEPTWTGPSRRLQVELTSPRPRKLRAAFVDVTGSVPTASAARAKRAQTANMAGINPRSAWDPNNQCKPRSQPGIGVVQGVAVHHTAGSNNYSADQVPAVILAICKYHRNSNGWNDVGYNVLVDKFGGAWEGRAGGLAQAVVGAHAQGFNAVSAGVSMIGDYTSIAPPPATVATVARVAAWKLAVAGVPRSGTVNLTSAGGSLSRYKQGAVATLPRVFGHRDVGQTACPGVVGYTILDAVRASVAGANPTLPVNLPATPAPPPDPVKVTISMNRRIDVGRRADVRGSVRQGSTPLKGTALALQVSNGDGWQTVATTTTSSSGKYRFVRKFTRSWRMRVVRTEGDGGLSALVKMVIVPKLTLTVPKRMTLNRKVTLKGTIAPGRGPVTLSIERRTSSGKYVSVAEAQATKLKGRRITATITPHSHTLYRFRLRYAGSEFGSAARSKLAYGRAVPAGNASGGTSL